MILLLALLLASPVRSSSTVHAFKAKHPCPAPVADGGCPGYVVDHVVPLCYGGPDAVANMQWQRADAARQKDVLELYVCRHMKACSGALDGGLR